MDERREIGMHRIFAAGRRRIFLQGAEFAQIGVPYITPQTQAHGAAIALALHQPCVLQFFQVVRDRGRADALVLAKRAAGKDWLTGDLLQNGKPARLAQHTGDRLHLLGRKLNLALRSHPLIIEPRGGSGTK